MAAKKRCQICEMHSATVKVRALKDGEEVELHICADCARFKGLDSDGTEKESDLAAFFKSASTNILGTETRVGDTNNKDLECSNCKMTFTNFQADGLLGCSECYQLFQSDLEPLLQRIHGSNKHSGSCPRPLRIIANEPDLAALKKELHLAISKENFERAADFRDLIRDLEREENDKSDC
ncbi:MAG: hypothetical protein DWQ05_07510 [Calditrichaeota bacterium]|nr:MAG: hypothetical protein DWQ05_07510 [Calditrichota bacterium]